MPSNKIAVICLECNKKFNAANICPVCPRCNSSDVDVRD